MRVNGSIAPRWQTINHACAPGIATEQPIKVGLFQFDKTVVFRKIAIPVALNGKGSCEIIAAPDERNTPIESILFRLVPYQFDAGLIISNNSIPLKAFQFFCKFIMTKIDKGIPLVMIGCVFS